MPQNRMDVDEDALFRQPPRILGILLKDRTTKKNIVWATDDYQESGRRYRAECEITPALITGRNRQVILPRIIKSQQSQWNRTKDRAEVFTPSWICNAQNNLIDHAWFGRGDVFNTEGEKSWTTRADRIEFDEEGERTWQNYVDSPRMEITCGEAPYLVSRYDAVNAEMIPVADRIGLLDRKLRVVGENTSSEKEWYQWVVRAYQSIYGYELQGDSLFLARENLLFTYMDYLKHRWKREAAPEELLKIATIISWNLWQMDGLTLAVPPGGRQEAGSENRETPPDSLKYCIIKDWRAIRQRKKGTIEYRSLLT